MMNILWAVLVLGLMGLVFGILLNFASKFFATDEDPRVGEIREALPGANCGACGYPGCDGCASAIVKGEASTSACTVGGAAVSAKVAAIMGVEADAAQEKKVAALVCRGDKQACKTNFQYNGIADCVSATTVADGPRACKFACIGLGTCVKACPFGAIHVDSSKGMAVVDEDKCTGCGACVKACPKGVLRLEAQNVPVRLKCHNPREKYQVSDNCRAGCIACEKCMNNCKFGAITMVNHLPVIDPAKCTGCMMCAEGCPTHALYADYEHRKVAEIDKSTCIGCTMCKRTCKFDAIKGEMHQAHLVTDVCTGCGECAKKCPKKCITMKTRSHARNTTVPAPVQPAAPAEKPKPQYSPEVQAKIDAALKAKAAKEAAAKAEQPKAE